MSNCGSHSRVQYRTAVYTWIFRARADSMVLNDAYCSRSDEVDEVSDEEDEDSDGYSDDFDEGENSPVKVSIV
jgi:hypothetical protein